MEKRTLLGRRETEELDRVLADLGVDEEPHGFTRGRQVEEGPERGVERVADAADVDHEALGRLLAERAGQGGDHDEPLRAGALRGPRATAAARPSAA